MMGVVLADLNLKTETLDELQQSFFGQPATGWFGASTETWAARQTTDNAVCIALWIQATKRLTQNPVGKLLDLGGQFGQA